MARRSGRRCRSCRKYRGLKHFRDSFARSCEDCRWARDNVPCVICGGETPGRLHTCSEKCRYEQRVRAGKAAAESRRRRLAENPPTARVCPACAVKKELTVEHWYVSTRDGETITGFNSICIPCARAYQRDKYHRDESRRQKALANAKRQRERETARRQRDPAFDAEYRARRSRGNARQKEKRENGHEPPSREGRALGPELPARPLAAVIDRIVADGAEEDVCGLLGINARSLRRWRSGERRVVRLEIADRVLTEAGLLWFDVWDPAEYPEVAEKLAA